MTNKTLDDHWSEVYKQGRDFTLISSQSIEKFLRYLPSNTKKYALDIGCGTGQLTRELSHLGFRVIGLDSSSEAISRAKRLTSLESVPLIYKQMDIENLDRKIAVDSKFSLITCKLVFAFIKDKQRFLNSISSLLDTKGIFVIITPLLGDVSLKKSIIAVDFETSLDMLQQNFKVDTYTDNGMTTFICRLKQ